MAYVLGIDIGGTKIKAGIIDEAGKLIQKNLYSTSSNLKSQIINIIDSWVSNFSIVSIGIGSAGRVSPKTGEIVFATSNLSNWTGVPLKGIIEKRFQLPVSVLNDSNAAAYGEWFIRNMEPDSMVLLTIGTGLGGGLIYNRKLVQGSRGEASEYGHVIIHPGGILCNCGKKGCAEQYISMKLIEERASNNIGHTLNRDELINTFKQKSSGMINIINDISKELAILIDGIFMSIDPEVIVIGGGISEFGNKFLEILREKLSKYTPTALYSLQDITLAKTGNDAGMIGAGIFSLEEKEKKNDS